MQDKDVEPIDLYVYIISLISREPDQRNGIKSLLLIIFLIGENKIVRSPYGHVVSISL